MKVNTNAPHSPNTLETTKTDKAAEKSKVTSKIDNHHSSAAHASGSNVEISDQARLLQKATEVVSQLPDIRTDRVASLKKSIKDGSYKIDAGALADKILDEHISGSFGKNSY